MTSKESCRLLMLCGALQDISEILSNSRYISKRETGIQVKEVQLKIENIVNKKFNN